MLGLQNMTQLKAKAVREKRAPDSNYTTGRQFTVPLFGLVQYFIILQLCITPLNRVHAITSTNKILQSTVVVPGL